MQKSNTDKENNNNTEIQISPFKNKYLKIIKGNYYYLLDKYKYDQNTIMMLLDLKKINILGSKFLKYENGVEKLEFIRLIKKELGVNPNDIMDETNLVYGLYKFFCEIDFNGDGHMQWEEFTQFIIDTVEGETQAIQGEKDEERKQKDENRLVKYKRYYISPKIKDYYIHRTNIIDGIFLPKSESLLIIEYRTKIIRIYNPKTGRIKSTINCEDELIAYGKNHQSAIEEIKPINKYIDLLFKAHHKKKKTPPFSVISLCASSLIVAVCLTNQEILFFNFNSEGKSDLVHKMKTPSLQKRVWNLPEHNIWFSSGVREHGEKYYYIYELDVEFELVNQKVVVSYNDNHPYRAKYCSINEHKKEIYDVIEINRPFLVLTGCLDGLIRLININDRKYLSVWNQHPLGVRHLAYNPNIESTGYILSSGFEYYISIYCTDLSVEDAYKGRLNGHSSPVVSLSFIADSPMSASIDEEVNVRIWDTKKKLCLQLILNENPNFKVENMLFMHKINKFLAYGNKIVFYEAKYNKEDFTEDMFDNEENIPICVEFNKYYQEFYITTLRDIRVYNKSGNFSKIFQKCRQNEHFEPDTKIKSFTFENNYRKFYLGFSNGAVMQYNAGNGSLIKAISEIETERDNIQIYKYDHSNEVSNMFYYYFHYKEREDILLLITAGLDSIINVYNESNPEEAEKLRTIKGGHTINDKKCLILCMDFSMTLCLLATGSSDGLVVIWNFEMSKIEDTFYINPIHEPNTDISNLKFLDPFPLIAVFYSNGSCALWGLSPFMQMKGLNILRFQTFYNTIFRVELCSITSSLFINQELDDIPKHFLFRKFFCNDEDSEQMLTERKVDSETGKCLPEIEVSEEFSYEKIDPLYDPIHYASSDRRKYLMVLCDSKGYIRILDFKGIIRKYDLDECSPYLLKTNFNILKKENLNVESILKHSLEFKKTLTKFINLYMNNIVICEWKAHEDKIMSVCYIEEPFTLVTISKDKYLKLWDNKTKLIGVINIFAKNRNIHNGIEWKFKMNEEKILKNEIKEVVKVFEGVGVNKILIGSKVDAEAQKIVVEEKEEEKKNEKLKPSEYHKKRFKPFESKKAKRTEEDAMNNSFEGYYIKETTKKIEGLLIHEPANEGVSQLGEILMNKLSQNDENNKNKEQKENNKTPTKASKAYVIKRIPSKRNIKSNNVIKPSKSNCNDTILVKPQINFNPSHSTRNLHFFPGKTGYSNKHPLYSTFYRNNSDINSNISSSKEFIQSKLYNKVRNKLNLKSSLSRNTFYSEKFIRRDEQLSKQNNLKANLLLPILKYDLNKIHKVSFEKGQTDKLLKYEFYNSSYKNCCESNKDKNFTNLSLGVHHKNMWSNVRLYVDEKKKEWGENENGLLEPKRKKRKKNLYKCASSLKKRFFSNDGFKFYYSMANNSKTKVNYELMKSKNDSQEEI